MNKNLKVISTVALAGLLAVNGFAPRALAVTDTISTTPAAIYSNLKGFENEKIATFVLADANDCVTFKEIANSSKFSNVTKFNGSSIPNDNELVKTGDTFVANGVTYTVVIYGDVNKDGYVDGQDASAIAKSLMRKVTLDKYQQEAADVVNDGELDGQDASYIAKFAIKKNTKSINQLPEDETVVEDLKYSLVANEGKIINNTYVESYTDSANIKVKTLKNISIVATPGTGITDQTLKLRLLVDGEVVEGTTMDVNSAFGTNNVTAPITVNGNTIKSCANGTITAELFYEDATTGLDVVVGRTNIEKQIIEEGNIKATNVSTERTNSRTGAFSIEAKDIAKAYYKVGGTTGKNTDFIDSKGALVDGVKEASVSNNKVTKAQVTGLTEDAANTISYMIVDSYGNEKIGSTIIALENAKKMQPATIAKLDLDKANKFTWTAPTKIVDGSAISLDASVKLSYTVNLYKNNEVVDTKTVTDTDDLEYVLPSKAGKYQISVKVNTTSDGKYLESDIAYSNEVEVSKLNVVENVKIEKTKTTVDNDTLKISWTDSNDTGYENGYVFKLYKIDSAGKVDEGTPITSSNIKKNDDNTEATFLFSELENLNNVVYYVTVEVNKASEQYKKLNSDEAESNKLINPTASGCNVASAVVTTTDATLTIESPILKIANEEVKYLVEFYDLGTQRNETTGKAELTYTANSMSKTYSLTPVKNAKGEITGYTIDIVGLQTGKTYVVKVFAIIDGEKVAIANTPKTGYTNNVDGYIQLKTKGVLPTFNGTISNVVADDFEAASTNTSNIVISGADIALNGVAYDTRAMNLTAEDETVFTRNLAIAKALHDGDVLNINGDNVTITLNSRETMGSLESIDLSDVTLTINENNGISRAIALATNTKKPEKLVLNGAGSIYTVTSGGANEIILNNNVEVKTNANSYIVVSGEGATVNGVKVAPTNDSTVTVSADGEVSVKKLAQTKFDATFNMDKAAQYTLTNFELKTIELDTTDRYTLSNKIGKTFTKYNSGTDVVYANEADLSEEYKENELPAGTVITTIKVAKDSQVRTQLAQIAGNDVKAYELIKFLNNFDAYKDMKVNITTVEGSKTVKLSFVGDQTISTTPAVRDGMTITIEANTTKTK